MRICIPTYKRARLLQCKTLAYLNRSGVQPSDVAILVADEEEQFSYAEQLSDEWADRLAVTAPGLSQSRNLVRERLEEGTQILWIDDDVDGVYRRLNDKETEEVPIYEVAEEGFRLAEGAGAALWGVYPTVNPMFMKAKLRQGLWHCVGPFYGEENSHNPWLKLMFGDAKEDYERTLRHFDVYGRVVRMDWYAVKTTFYRKDEGGIQNRSPQSVEATVRRLERRWPDLVRRNPRRKSEYPEILLQEPKEEASVA